MLQVIVAQYIYLEVHNLIQYLFIFRTESCIFLTVQLGTILRSDSFSLDSFTSICLDLRIVLVGPYWFMIKILRKRFQVTFEKLSKIMAALNSF